MDTYCPGAIQETLDGMEDFNDRSFSITFGELASPCSFLPLPDEEPLTLLEAFSLRIDKEKQSIVSSLPEKATEEQ